MKNKDYTRLIVSDTHLGSLHSKEKLLYEFFMISQITPDFIPIIYAYQSYDIICMI